MTSFDLTLKDTLDTIDKLPSVLETLDQKMAKLEQKMSWSGGVEQKLAALRSKTANSASTEDEVDRPTLDSKLDAMAERIQVCLSLYRVTCSIIIQIISE